MPEEINRVLTDQISDLLFTTEKSARENLLREGIAGVAHPLRRQRHDRHAALQPERGRAAAQTLSQSRRCGGLGAKRLCAC